MLRMYDSDPKMDAIYGPHKYRSRGSGKLFAQPTCVLNRNSPVYVPIWRHAVLQSPV